MKPLHKKNKHKDKHSYNDKNFDGVIIIIHSAKFGEAKLNTLGEFFDAKTHFYIHFSIKHKEISIPYEFEAKFLRLVDITNEEVFIPFLIDCMCLAYNWCREMVFPFDEGEFFLINYEDAKDKKYEFIKESVAGSRENSLNVKQFFVKITWHNVSSVVPGKVIHVGTYTKAVDSDPKRVTPQEPWFKKLWRRIKNVWIR